MSAKPAGSRRPSGFEDPPRRKSKAARKTAPKAPQRDALPDFVPPCLATLQEKPPAGERWLHEVKFDGYRLQARIDHGAVRLLTRSGLDWTERFGATLSKALAELPCATALIDGEVVALSDSGVSSFGALQEALSEGATGALVFFGFDLLHLDGQDLRADPLLARKGRLEDLFRGADEPARCATASTSSSRGRPCCAMPAAWGSKASSPSAPMRPIAAAAGAIG